MAYSKLITVVALFVSFSPVYAWQDVDIRPIKPSTARPVKRPTKSQKARVATNGVLFVLTDPPAADITVKNSQGGEVKREAIEDGEFRAELAAGVYDIEIAAAGYYPVAKRGIAVKPPLAKIERAELKLTTGSITIGMGQIELDSAIILIDEKSPAALNIKVRMKKEENQIEFDNVAEGFHTLSITHPSIAPYRRDKLEVRGGSITLLTPVLKPAVVNFVVRSEPGATIFIDGNNVGRVQENGVLKVSNDYKPGSHTIRAEMEDKFEPNEISGNFETGERPVEVALTRIKTSPEFSQPFLADTYKVSWDAPPPWQVIQGKMAVKGIDPGLIRERRYDDFRMVFDISFINGKGAAWIVRARDRQNYYLFQLTGPKSASPNFFRGYHYQNGQFKLLDYVKVVENLSIPGDSFTITVEADGPTIKHFIRLKSDPAAGSKLMHTLTDKSLTYGTVGFQAKDDEEFYAYTMIVMPGKPKPPATR
jgi:hypothetical protein